MFPRNDGFEMVMQKIQQRASDHVLALHALDIDF